MKLRLLIMHSQLLFFPNLLAVFFLAPRSDPWFLLFFSFQGAEGQLEGQ